MSRFFVSAELLPGIIPVACAWLAARSLFEGNSLAYYRQDWGWPATPEQLLLSFWSNLGAWDSTGLGVPNHQPMLHPAFLAWHAMAAVMPPWAVGAITIFLCLCFFGVGVSAGSRALFGAAPLAGALAGGCAVLGAPLLNKICAGHIYYLIALAAYPWTIRFGFARDERYRLNAFAAGAVTAICAIQIQIFVAAIVTLGAGALRGGRARAAWSAVSIAAAFTLVLPEAFAYLHPSVVKSLSGMETTLFWQYNNSSPAVLAALSMGYAPGYYHHAADAMHARQIVEGTVWTMLAAAAAGVLMRIRDRVTWTLLALWVLAFCLVAGLFGPLAAPLAYLYTHELWASAFRELYHFAGVEWTLTCVLAASALGSLPVRYGAGILACGVVLLALPWWPPHYAGQLKPFGVSAYAAAAIRSEARTPGSDRFLLLPSEWPIAPPGYPLGGEDPFAYAAGEHPAANTYRLYGILEAAAAYTESGDPAGARWRAVAGIGSVISRRDVVSRLLTRFAPLHRIPPYVSALINSRRLRFANGFTVEPVCMFCSYFSVPVVRNAADAAHGDAFMLLRDTGAHDGRDPDLASAADRYEPVPSHSAADPSLAWVSSQQWAWLDPRIALDGTGVLTWSRAPLRYPHEAGKTTYAHVLLLHGELSAGRVALRVPMDRPAWVKLPAGAHELHVLDGLGVVNRFVTLKRYRPLRALPSRFSPGNALSFDWVGERGHGRIAGGTRYVALKEAYSPGWHLQLARGRVLRHFVMSGYANGWEVSAPRTTQVSVYYRSHRAVRLVEALSLGLWFITLLAALVRT